MLTRLPRTSATRSTRRSTAKHWITVDRYDSQGRLILEAEPSAVTGYNPRYAADERQAATSDLPCQDSTRRDRHLRLRHLHHRDGHHGRRRRGLRQGRQGPERPRGHADPARQHPVHRAHATVSGVSATVYPHGDLDRLPQHRRHRGRDDQLRVHLVRRHEPGAVRHDLSRPSISAAENGPGTARHHLDRLTTPTAGRSGPGTATATSTTPPTTTPPAPSIKSIADVNTADTGEFTDLPSGWSTPTGGGLNLVTTYQVDGLGPAPPRTPTRTATSPTPSTTTPTTRSASTPGWNATTGTTTGPTMVTREDRAGSYFETLTMSAAPATLRPAATSPPAPRRSPATSRRLDATYTDTAGRPIEDDQYSTSPA